MLYRYRHTYRTYCTEGLLYVYLHLYNIYTPVLFLIEIHILTTSILREQLLSIQTIWTTISQMYLPFFSQKLQTKQADLKEFI